MARNIKPASIAMLNKRVGGECITLVEILWTRNSGWFRYADRFIKGVTIGKLLEVSNLEAIIDVNKSGSSTSLHVKISDKDATIKNIFNYNDIHNRPVRVYQWFTNLPLSEKILIFEGGIASPIVWDEGTRSLEFDVLTMLADHEVGFSPEEGRFDGLPSELIGKPWPLIFGTVINATTVKMDELPNGILAEDIGIPDHNIKRQLTYIKNRQSNEMAKAACYSRVGARLKFEGGLGGAGREVYELGQQYQRQARDIYNGMAREMQSDIQRLGKIDQEQKAPDKSSFRVIGGRNFKQGETIELDINGAKYIGTFEDETFSVQSRQPPKRDIARTPGTGAPAHIDQGQGYKILVEDTEEFHDRQWANFYFNEPIEYGTGGEDRTSVSGDPCSPPKFYPPAPIQDSISPSGSEPPRESEPFFAKAGTSIRIGGAYSVRYIVGVTDGIQLISVSAKKSVGGVIKLVEIPQDLYTTGYQTFGSVTAYIITLKQPLSTISDEDWQDELFATVRSNVGPNVVDILQWAIFKYTPYAINAASFAQARVYVAPFPANFAMYDRKNIQTFLKEVAYQARLAIWMKEDVFFIKYLPATGTLVDTLTEDDVEVASMQITTTPTEEVITKYVATWKNDYSRSDSNKLILRWNIGKYGLHEETYDYYIYNQEALVMHSATFWMLRRGNVWKILKCKAFITKLKAETLDNMLLNFTYNWIANVAVVGQVEKVTFNSADLSLDFEIWTPVRLGEMYPYGFAYPAGLGKESIFPNEKEEVGQIPGGDGPGAGATGDLSYGAPASGQVETFTRPRDLGALNPGDLDASFPTLETTAGIYNASGPAPTYDYKFRQYPRKQVPIDQVASKSIPIQIISYKGPAEKVSNAHVYTAKIYNFGIDGKPVEGEVIQLNQHPEDKLPKDTWQICTRTVYYEKEKPRVEYYIQAPTFLKKNEE